MAEIGEYAFCDCTKLETIIYDGSADDWKDITIKECAFKNRKLDENGEFVYDSNTGDNVFEETAAKISYRCQWCGKHHGDNFFQKVIIWFHNIFTKLFGAKF